MTIFVDEPVPNSVKGSRGKHWCHLWSDTSDEELDAFAESIGLKSEWAQISRGAFIRRFYHYDLAPNKHAQAIEQGAVEIALNDYIRRVIQNGSDYHDRD